MNSSGTTHTRNIPDKIDVDISVEAMNTLKMSFPDLFTNADSKKYVAKCRKDRLVSECNWQEIKAKTISTDVLIGKKVISLSKEKKVSSYKAKSEGVFITHDEVIRNDKMLRNFISKCATCQAKRFDSEIIKG